MKILDKLSFLGSNLFQKTLLFFLIIVFTTLLTSTFFLSSILQEILEEHTGRKALTLSKTISLIPQVINLVELDDPEGELQHIITRIREGIDAQFIVIGDKNSLRLTHPVIDRIGEKMVGDDNERALKYKEYYVSKATGTLGPSIRGKSPIFNSQGEVIGIVSVGYLEKNIKEIVEGHHKAILTYIYVTLVSVLLLAGLFAKRLKRSLLGYEPKEISRLFLEKEAILNSVEEAIIATNTHAQITLFNNVAKAYFHFDTPPHLLPPSFEKFLLTCKERKDVTIEHEGVEYICSFSPMQNKAETMGMVLSCRKKEEIDTLVWELTRVKQYSEKLREKKHEFSNLLHLISGYIQIGEYTKAIALIAEQNLSDEHIIHSFQAHLQDPVVTSILIGKYYYAFEKGVKLFLDENSTLSTPIPPSTAKHLLTILGNVLNNAIDAAKDSQEKKIHVFITDIGNDIIFDIEDSGEGIPEALTQKVFEKGFSTKGALHSGYGLYFVHNALKELGGFMSIDQGTFGTNISVHIPKGAPHD
ncbi:MAG: sensor histidine kinase [Campylobacterales bacterium]|nr:sensor histidine kinase [Campylobacterales bacterium]